MKITIGGNAGSGKSTVGKIISKQTGYKFYSMGGIWRDIAKNHGKSFEEFHKLAEKDPLLVDQEVDEYQKKLSYEKDLIVDSRLGFHFIPESFKVWISVDKEEGARRIYEENRLVEKYKSVKEVKKSLEKRQKKNISRFKKIYGIKDYTDEIHYDLLVDSTNLNPEETADLIITELKRLKNGE